MTHSHLFLLERVNYDAMGWEKSKTNDDRLFAVRTVLWGLPSNAEVPISSLPILDVGEYNFPFICQMPVINYPPTFQHHLIATSFHTLVCVEKGDGSTPILSKLTPVRFQPIIETIPVKNLLPFKEETKLPNHISAQVIVPQLAFSILDRNQSIPVTVKFMSSENQQQISLSHLRVYIKRYYGINYKTFSRNEATIIAQYDHAKLPSVCPCSINMKLDIPSSQEDLPPTLEYSPHLSINYKLVVSVKIRHGPIHVKKKLFEMPLLFGTLPSGTRAPRQLEPYSNIVENRSSLENVPHFIRPEPRQSEEDEFLPAYDSENVPPAYTNNSNMHTPILI